MRVRGVEQPVPFDEPAVGYFAPPPEFVVGNEWRLIQGLRDAAMSGSALTTLTDGVVAQVREALGVGAPIAPQGLGMALADLAVTGRMNYSSFVGLAPQDGGQFETDAAAKLAASGLAGVTPGLVRKAAGEVLDRAYQVAWYLRAQTWRGDLGWLAVSGEDDLPHRPVNVPRTPYPQHDLYFTVPGDLGEVVVQTRYAIATADVPQAAVVTLPQRHLPPVLEPELPKRDKLILFINGSDSRLEEAADLVPRLVRLPDGRPSGYAVITVDLPGSGYVNLIDHTEVGAWPPTTGQLVPPFKGTNEATFSVLKFMERFIGRFVATLSTRLGQPGLVESRLVAVIGGSLGGNLGLRLARHGSWVPNVVAWSPGSVWYIASASPEALAIQFGTTQAAPRVGEAESGNTRDAFFANAFDQKIPDKTQPELWYRDDFPPKGQYINNARWDRRETYTPQYRRWHWRVSLEELVWSWQFPQVQDFKSRVLLAAGTSDDIFPAKICSNCQTLASQLTATDGDTYFPDHTGHSMHAERPKALAAKILEFIAEPPPPPPDPALVASSLPAWELLLS
jgi:pimeloyl-ACP methyl ester carboxylesterase